VSASTDQQRPDLALKLLDRRVGFQVKSSHDMPPPGPAM
jgi:hypothetical protein